MLMTCFSSPTEESTLAILPISLAAAMRVDSCHIPSLKPSIQWCISCPVIEARLQNHPQYLGQGKILNTFLSYQTNIRHLI